MRIRWDGPTTRVDKVLRTLGVAWTRTAVNAAIGTGRVRVDGRVVRLSSWEVVDGALVEVDGPAPSLVAGPTSFDPAWVVADEGDSIVLDKPQGLRPEAVRASDTTPNLLALLRAELGEDLALAHRIDRDTSGLVVATRPGAIRNEIVEMFRAHTVSKQYVAVVDGSGIDALTQAGSGRWSHYVDADPKRRDRMVVVARGGKTAVTDWEVIRRERRGVRLYLWPRTGRTHQLRIQCAHMDVPILGDRLYGATSTGDRLLLHAERLTLPFASGAREYHARVLF